MLPGDFTTSDQSSEIFMGIEKLHSTEKGVNVCDAWDPGKTRQTDKITHVDSVRAGGGAFKMITVIVF